MYFQRLEGAVAFQQDPVREISKDFYNNMQKDIMNFFF